MRRLAIVLFLLYPVFSTAAQNSNEIQRETVPQQSSNSKWSIEGDLQAHSVAGSASPWLGLAGAYRVFEILNLGLRGFLPLSQSVDKSSYAIQAFTRTRIVHGLNTDLFIEAAYSENFYQLIPFGSYGLATGISTRIAPGLSVGVLGGLEFAKVVVDSVGVENESNFVVYPKIALLANFNF